MAMYTDTNPQKRDLVKIMYHPFKVRNRDGGVRIPIFQYFS